MKTLRLKTWRDLWLYQGADGAGGAGHRRGRGGVAGVATTSLIVLRRDLREGYRATNPAHAILRPTSPFDAALAAQVAEACRAWPRPRRGGWTAARLLPAARRLPSALALPCPISPADGRPPFAPGRARRCRRRREPSCWSAPAARCWRIAVGDAVTVRLMDGDTFAADGGRLRPRHGRGRRRRCSRRFTATSTDATAARLGLPAAAISVGHVRLDTEGAGERGPGSSGLPEPYCP
jgi:hypothetical protein